MHQSFNKRFRGLSRIGRPGVYGLVALVALAAGLVVHHVRAAGIPQMDVLTYTGHLVDKDGVEVTGDKSIGVALYAAQAGGAALCAAPASDITLAAGRFQLALPDDCTAVVKGQPDLWIEVQVDGEALGRTKIGAVPFAIEAGHAASADSVAGAQSGFRAGLNMYMPLDDATPTQAVFDRVEFDLGGELDKATGEFAPAVPGYYFVQCAPTFGINQPNAGGVFETQIMVDGVEMAATTAVGTGQTRRGAASVILKVDAGSVVTCEVEQRTGFAQFLDPASTRFEGARLSISE